MAPASTSPRRASRSVVAALLVLAILLAGAHAAASPRAEPTALEERVTFVRSESVTADASRWDASRWDASRWDASRWDGSRWDGSRWDGSRWDGSRWDASRWDRTDSPATAWIPWGLRAIGAPEAWAAGAPAGTRLVCLVDSGLDETHPALAGRLLRDADGRFVAWDFVDGDATPQDEGGHGTHLAGIVAAAHDPHRGIAGVGAPLVTVARVLDAHGVGTTDNVVAGIAWCVGQQAHVILLALTEDSPTAALAAGIRAAQDAGALVVASAGNAGPCANCVSFPAAYDGVVGVGALDPSRTVAAFSSSGAQVDLLAPGVGIRSTFPGGVATGSGTSQAAAFAAGAAAFVWAREPGWSATAIAAHLAATAAPHESGVGVLDLAAAVGANAPR